jgi:hypothetical protein
VIHIVQTPSRDISAKVGFPETDFPTCFWRSGGTLADVHVGSPRSSQSPHVAPELCRRRTMSRPSSRTRILSHSRPAAPSLSAPKLLPDDMPYLLYRQTEKIRVDRCPSEAFVPTCGSSGPLVNPSWGGRTAKRETFAYRLCSCSQSFANVREHSHIFHPSPFGPRVLCRVQPDPRWKWPEFHISHQIPPWSLRAYLETFAQLAVPVWTLLAASKPSDGDGDPSGRLQPAVPPKQKHSCAFVPIGDFLHFANVSP